MQLEKNCNINTAQPRLSLARLPGPAACREPVLSSPAQGSQSIELGQEEGPMFLLDNAEQLPVESFPNKPSGGIQYPRSTIPNVQHLLKSYGIAVKYDVIKKKLLVLLPNQSGSFENADSVALTQILSLATLNGMSTHLIPGYVEALADRTQHNAAANWINSAPWDGQDRLHEFYSTLVERDEYPKQLKQALMKRWLISAAAAVLMPHGFHSRGVLTLQGPQAIGKTSWIKSLISDRTLSSTLIKVDHHLDASNKDSILTAVGHWVVEIGELDSSFKKDVARLKGFLTSPSDKIRRPYARGDAEYQRRTVFCATVNDTKFLVDQTGNSRWWTIPVTQINFAHGIDMQQLFAQMAVAFVSGEQWWLTKDEEESLGAQNSNHLIVSAIHELLLDKLDIARAGEVDLPAMSAIEVLKKIGLDRPTNPQCRECGAFLRANFGESKRIQGNDKWRVPLREDAIQ
jgi:predicted P-loop ATPase